MPLLDSAFLYPAAGSLTAVIGSVFDVRSRRIPNLLTGPAFLAGLMLHTAVDGWRGLAMSFAAGLICGVVFLVFYLAGGMGAGDVKLIACVGAMAGFSNVLFLLIFTALAGGAMAVAFALARGRLKQTFSNVAALASHHRAAGLSPHPEFNVRNANTLRLPYALAIAAGSCITLYLQGMQR